MPGAVVPVGPVVVEVVEVVVVIVVGAGEPLLGRYLIPLDGQSELEPTSTRVSKDLTEFDLYEDTWVCGDEHSRLYAALNVIKIPYFVQLVCICTLNDGTNTSRRFKSRKYLGRCVGCRRGGNNASVSQPSVRRQSFEEGDDFIEEIDDLLLRGIVGITVGV